jgi:hypothetical protein
VRISTQQDADRGLDGDAPDWSPLLVVDRSALGATRYQMEYLKDLIGARRASPKTGR